MKKIQLVSLTTLVVLLTGCGGALKKWKEETFAQAESYKSREHESVVKEYFKSLSLYDQFETIGIFDALWLSDEIKTVVSDIHVQLLGKNKEVRNNFLRRQLKDNSDYVSFYVLSQHGISLVDHPTQWHLHLVTEGGNYSPASVKLIEVTPEYRIVLAKKFTSHKDVYEVKFLRKNSKGKDILQEGKELQLFFNGLHHFGCVKWSLDLQTDFLHHLES